VFLSQKWIIVLAVMVLLLASCASETQNGTNSVPVTAATSTPAPAETAAATATQVIERTATLQPTATEAPVPGVSFQNPVIRLDFPDPFILPVGDQFYAYATNSSGRNVQAAVSDDLVNWRLLNDAMPALASWASLRSGLVWAPEVLHLGDQFLLYYTARDTASDRQCIGVAVSDNPAGRFRDTRDEPLVCQVDEGGSIDASPYREDDKLYLFWKNDGNCCGRTTWIYVQEMAPDGLSLVGEPVRLVSNDRPWEGMVVEAPSMIQYEDQYYLFFSANNYGGVEYSVGYAVCESVTGPCQDAPENPILKSYLQRPPVIGPGHQTLLLLDDQWWIIYHAWEVSPQGLKTDRRMVWMDRLEWEDGKPVVQGPTTGVQPVPEVP
jgi:beta-xylosidase